MSEKQNLERARQWFEAMWSTGDEALADALVHPDYAPDWVQMEERGPAQVKREMRYFRGVFPDLSYTVVDHAADGNKVWTRTLGRGTQAGAAWGFKSKGQTAEFETVNIFTFAANGQVIDRWAVFSMYDLFHQLGHVPPWWELGGVLHKE
jgi:predicted ester cyclase